MPFRQRLATWAITGFLQQTFFVAVSAIAAVVLVASALIVFGSLAIRAVLPAIDRHVERGWTEALGPLSALAERYPPLEKNAAARQVEVFAATLGISVAADEDSAAPVPSPLQTASFRAVRNSLLTDNDADGHDSPGIEARNDWLRRNRPVIEALGRTVIEGDVPIWALDLGDCVGRLAVKLDGLADLQAAVLASAHRSIEAGDLGRAAPLLDASWRLNDTLQRSPRLEEHLVSVAVVDRQMAVLRRHPSPGNHWKVRLAAVDLERRALETVRLNAWSLRCRASSVLDDLHPGLGVFAQPFARLLAIPQHLAMMWAVDELPKRDVVSFDADRFVAEQHRRIPRWNSLARSGLPHDWSFWPESIRGSLDVELSLRTLELYDAIRFTDRFNPTDLAPRQPSRVRGVEWRYTVGSDSVEIALDDSAWPNQEIEALRATVALSFGPPPGGEP